MQPKEAEKEFPTWKKTRTFLSGIECQRWAAGQSLEMISHVLLAILGHFRSFSFQDRQVGPICRF